VVKQIGDLTRAIVGVDRHTADTKRVQRQLVQDVFGPVLQQCGTRGDIAAADSTN
jgi:hypothetical protein